MTPFEASETDARERRACADEVAADGQRRLVLGTLGDEVAARVLGQVAHAAVPLDRACLGLEKPGDELRERRLARAVATREGDDLAATKLERCGVERPGGSVRVART